MTRMNRRSTSQDQLPYAPPLHRLARTSRAATPSAGGSRSRLGVYFTLLAAVSVRRLTLLADDGEGGGVVGSAARTEPVEVPDLEHHQRTYLEDIDQTIRWYSWLAARRLTRYRILAISALLAAAAVPVTIAASAPGWVAAALGAAAATAQGTLQVLQDQRTGVECHGVAVELSRARRRFAYDLGRHPAQRRISTFDSFVREVEAISEAVDIRMINLLRTDGTRMADGTSLQPNAGSPPQQPNRRRAARRADGN